MPLQSMLKQDYLRTVLIGIVTVVVLIMSKLFFWKKKKRIWLIGCGSERWGDNADAFWRYMIREHPEIRVVAVVKNKTALNTKNIYWVKRNSLKNYFFIMQAEVFATTHTLSEIGPDNITSFSNAKKVWLQHGVTGIGKITAEKAKDGAYDMICVNSKKEKEIMEQVLGIASELLSITGFPRHDILKEKAGTNLNRDGILFIPTSRAWLDQNKKKEYETMLFSWVENLYRIGINKSIKTWLHPGWYKSGLDDLGLRYNEIEHHQLNKDPQQLILESRLLITDYSSIFFDAALSGIPTIFYQPDRESYIKNKGLFRDFLEQDLLLIVYNEEELIAEIEAIMKYADYYKQRLKKDQEWAHQYVETYDGNSCQRIYEHIEQMLK